MFILQFYAKTLKELNRQHRSEGTVNYRIIFKDQLYDKMIANLGLTVLENIQSLAFFFRLILFGINLIFRELDMFTYLTNIANCKEKCSCDNKCIP